MLVLFFVSFFVKMFYIRCGDNMELKELKENYQNLVVELSDIRRSL